MRNLKPYTWKIIFESVAVVAGWIILGLLNALAADVFYFNEGVAQDLRVSLGVVIGVMILVGSFIGCIVLATTFPRWRYYKEVFEKGES